MRQVNLRIPSDGERTVGNRPGSVWSSYLPNQGRNRARVGWLVCMVSPLETDDLIPMFAVTARDPGPYSAPTRAGRDLLDAVEIALQRGVCQGQSWYASTLELQLGSMKLCEVCRRFSFIHMRMTRLTPVSLWAPASYGRQFPQRSRVPPLQARVVTWDVLPNELIARARLSMDRDRRGSGSSAWMQRAVWTSAQRTNGGSHWNTLPDTASETPPKMPVGRSACWLNSLQRLILGDTFDGPVGDLSWLTSLQQLTFGYAYNQPIGDMRWPTTTEELIFGYSFNQAIHTVCWPESLRRLVFGDSFDYPIEKANWPNSLEQLRFGGQFNQPVRDVRWPSSLELLTFGSSFNQDISKTAWPASLRLLTLGSCFNRDVTNVSWPPWLQQMRFGDLFDRPIQYVRWPTSLRELTFGRRFNKSICNLQWPDSLQQLTFGARFNQPARRVRWPPSLRRLKFGHEFNRAIGGVRWPASLQQLSFGHRFNQLIREVRWPASLSRLTFGHSFNQDIVEVQWPASLQWLTFGNDFNKPIENVRWPASLLQLTFGSSFNHDIGQVQWPPSIQELTFGEQFNRPIGDVRWSASLERLTFGGCFNQDIRNVRWPTGLRELTFGHGFNKPIGDIQWPASLQLLAFGDGFKQPIHHMLWPTSLPALTVKDRRNRTVLHIRRPKPRHPHDPCHQPVFGEGLRWEYRSLPRPSSQQQILRDTFGRPIHSVNMQGPSRKPKFRRNDFERYSDNYLQIPRWHQRSRPAEGVIEGTCHMHPPYRCQEQLMREESFKQRETCIQTEKWRALHQERIVDTNPPASPQQPILGYSEQHIHDVYRIIYPHYQPWHQYQHQHQSSVKDTWNIRQEHLQALQGHAVSGSSYNPDTHYISDELSLQHPATQVGSHGQTFRVGRRSGPSQQRQHQRRFGDSRHLGLQQTLQPIRPLEARVQQSNIRPPHFSDLSSGAPRFSEQQQ